MGYPYWFFSAYATLYKDRYMDEKCQDAKVKPLDPADKKYIDNVYQLY